MDLHSPILSHEEVKDCQEVFNEQGYIVLQNKFSTGTEFESITSSVVNSTDFINYNETQGSVQRDVIAPNTLDVGGGAPGIAQVFFHNEQGYSNTFPNYVAFGCFAPAMYGGTTHISCSHQFTSDLKTKYNSFYHRLANEGVTYLRNLCDKNIKYTNDNGDCNNDYSDFNNWQGYFGTECLDTALERYKDNENESIVYDKDSGIVTHKFKRFVMDNYNSYKSNNVLIHSICDMHGRYFDYSPEMYENIRYWQRPTHAQWGNGDEFTNEEIAILDGIYEKNKMDFDLRKGDMIIVNNLRFTHARSCFVNGNNLNQIRKMGVIMLKKCKRM